MRPHDPRRQPPPAPRDFRLLLDPCLSPGGAKLYRYSGHLQPSAAFVRCDPHPPQPVSFPCVPRDPRKQPPPPTPGLRTVREPLVLPVPCYSTSNSGSSSVAVIPLAPQQQPLSSLPQPVETIRRSERKRKRPRRHDDWQWCDKENQQRHQVRRRDAAAVVQPDAKRPRLSPKGWLF